MSNDYGKMERLKKGNIEIGEDRWKRRLSWIRFMGFGKASYPKSNRAPEKRNKCQFGKCVPAQGRLERPASNPEKLARVRQMFLAPLFRAAPLIGPIRQIRACSARVKHRRTRLCAMT